MKIILHIGQSKTGTSAIQDFLTRHRKQLAERGILYPSPRVHGLPIDFGNHNPLADSLAGVVRYPHMSANEYFSQFFSDADRMSAKLMILSAEHFFGGQPRVWDVKDEADYFLQYRKKVETLRGYIGHHQVSIIVYLRPQVDWLSSSIAQVITFGRLVHKDLSHEDDRSYYERRKFLLRYGSRLDIWEEVLRPRELQAVPYVRERLFQKSSVSDFLERCGIDFEFAKVEAANARANISLSREYLEVKRLLNREPKSRSVERAIVHSLKKLSRESSLGTAYRVDPEVVKDLEAYVAEDNSKLTQRYVIGSEPFVAKVAYRGDDMVPLDETLIARARTAFEQEYSRPLTTLFILRDVTLATLRRYVTPAHAAVHQAKRLWRSVRYGRRRHLGKPLS
ncbi:hypothetical protein SAMN04488061_3555 [Filomicrobium insigne]|uniref:Sulfotransferase family protein n=1 Tax=Filomicrobium insigne TaxID=418854 RepID=A0A1H0UAW9_9HYPH|nr:hypothetical protein [Filomicrobium insigne]SDP63319.1 hypothetical protein SAMN04488061_3555 [Filomicrobium insigne]